MPVFETTIFVRFEHVDAAGIVYYPRYFSMLSEVVEDWFREGLGINFRKFHVDENRSIPLVDVRCKFMNPSYLADVLTFQLTVTRLGNKSVSYNVTATCDDEQRLEAEMTIVFARTNEQDKSITSEKIPVELREKIKNYMA